MKYFAAGSAFVLLTVAVVRRLLLRSKRKCPSKTLLPGKTVIITGANSGLGRAAAFELAKRKARVILACRSLSSAQATSKEIRTATGNSEIIPKELDLGSLKSIQKFSQEILVEEDKIDVLLNNAGVFQCPYCKTEDGFEMQMGVNHLGHFALTLSLLERIKQSSPSRIVIVSSSLSRRGTIQFEDFHCEKSYIKSKAYADSKLANLMFARHLARQLDGTGVDVLALHPGMVATNLGRHVVSPITKTIFSPLVVLLGLRDATEGCQTLVYCAVADEVKGKSGTYIGTDFHPCEYPPLAMDEEAVVKLWELSKKLTKV
ncbi:reverse transcriptase [Plakobranchus ocellatus]|uniref:Reverse transcriptase n=1 Tax=Plakobranchus ocellatus TaxID=259542 RepID=A0AAV3YH13_9GAST|nr:reverse transcriptase [Plakobranchus ocellatus]